MTRLVQPIPPMNSQENAKKQQIWLVSLSQNTIKMRKINRPAVGDNAVDNAVRIHLHVKFQAIPPMHSEENCHKPQIWPVSLSQNDTQLRKINRPWPKFHKFVKWSGYISMPKFRPFVHCVLQKNVRKLQIWSVSLSQNDAKMRKINRWWPKSNQFWSHQDKSACQISGHSKWLQ